MSDLLTEEADLHGSHSSSFFLSGSYPKAAQRPGQGHKPFSESRNLALHQKVAIRRCTLGLDPLPPGPVPSLSLFLHFAGPPSLR